VQPQGATWPRADGKFEDAWSQRLYSRGYQYLLPRRGGGWVALGFSGTIGGTTRNKKFWGNETNIYGCYEQIITAALSRDIPGVQFQARDPEDDADITAKEAASNYARVFESQNDLLGTHMQIANYLCTDGRVVLITDHVIDAQRFGREPLNEPAEPVVPETEEHVNNPLLYIVRHGETEKNAEGKLRGESQDPLNKLGRREAEKVAAFLKGKNISRIVCSPVQRSVETAEYVSQALGVPYDVDDRLAAFDLGTLTGEDAQKNAEEIREIFTGEEEAPGGENVEEFNQRVASAILDLLRTPGLPFAIVCHDSVISSVGQFLNPEIPYGITNVPPGGVAVVEQKEDANYDMRPIFPKSTGTQPAGIKRGIPRGQEVVEVCGKLEAKVPIVAQSLDEMDFVKVSREFDVARLKAMFPKKADKIKPGGSGVAEIELDRIARINVSLSLEASYVTGDSLVKDVTLHRIWMRPAMFMEVEDLDVRRELFDAFPDGVKCYMAGDTFIEARNECMDDHLTLIQALPGTGQNRKSLMSSLTSIQRRLNNWLDLADAYMTKCVPHTAVDTVLFDVDALNKTGSNPGAFIPVDSRQLQGAAAGKPIADSMFVFPTPTGQPFMIQLIMYFIEQLPQLIVHALPTLFGSTANTDVANPSGVALEIQRDQALATQGTPWHAMKMATCNYHRQAVQLAARCRNASIHQTDKNGEAVDIEIDDLKGNVLCFPQDDAGYSESPAQRQAAWNRVLMQVTNPLVMKLLSKVANIRAAMESFRIGHFKCSEADAYDKQMGELDVLLASGPVPNPAKQQAQMAFEQAKAQAAAKMLQGVVITPEETQALMQMEAAINALPDLVSTVPVRDTDDHASEAEACLDVINDPRGRKLANGSPEEQAAFLNLNLHFSEHKAKVPPPEPVVKPMNISGKLSDLPAESVAKELQRRGDTTVTGSDVSTTREFQAELEKSKHPTGPAVPMPIVAPGPQV